MLRQIIHIDRDKCNGCGLCAAACHEGAIAMVDGKARLLREDYCDGLGDCLPACPTGAITFETREAPAYDAAAVAAGRIKAASAGLTPGPTGGETVPSQLRQWPVQLKLVPVSAPYFQGADLLVAADCTAYAYGGFHGDLIRGRVVVIGCPKLDEGDHSEKLAAILTQNEVKSVTVARMEVPCCGGIERAAKAAVERSGKDIPITVRVISTDGRILQ